MCETIRSVFREWYYPASQPIGAVLILHGMMEHCGRYETIAKYFADNGFVVLCYDHPGHGGSVKHESELGFFQMHAPHQLLIDEARKMTDYITEAYPSIPLYLLAHSMGSFIARCILQTDSMRYRAVILSGTGGPVTGSFWAKQLLVLLNFIAPYLRSNFINKAFTAKNTLRFTNENPNDGTQWLSLSVKNRNDFQNDPLCGVDFSNNGFLGLINLVRQATKRNWAATIRRDLPILFVSGTEDPVGNFSVAIKDTVDELKKTGHQHVHMKLYDGMRHEILNEHIRFQVLADILMWIGYLNN